jgi:ornithine cyclodeaminase
MHRTMQRCQKVLCVSEDAVKACLEMKDCLRVNRKAFIDLAQLKAIVPPRIMIPHHAASAEGSKGAADFSLFKPAAIPDENLLAIKLVSIRQNNPSRGLPLVPATIVSIDPSTGIVNGLVAGTYLTGARTATGSALSTALYRPDLQRLVLVGAGLQARLHLQAIATALGRPIPHVTLVNRTVSRAQALAQQVRETTDWIEEIEVLALQSPDPLALVQAMNQADVIVTATNASQPLFPEGVALAPGCHLCSVGSYTPAMQEIPAHLVDQCTIVIDTPDARTVGDLCHLTDVTPVHLLGDILAASSSPLPRHPGKPYSFFKSVGTAIQDVYMANLVLQKARELHLGTEIEL